MAPNGDDVRRQLDRLLASSGFKNAGRMSRFLRFVVERTLTGEGERLKEYVIGIEVFDRETDYDPRVDSIVRVEAARLRTKLAEYYASEGRDDAVVLSLPKGGYSPLIKIEQRPAATTNGATANGATANGAGQHADTAGPTEASAAAQTAAPPSRARHRPVAAAAAGTAILAVAAWAAWTTLRPIDELRIAVLPFTPYPDDAGVEVEAVAMRITEGVTAALVRDGRFAVVASSAASVAAATAARPRDVAETLDADVLIEARLTTDGHRVRVEARASSGSREEKLWVANFAGDATDSDVMTREIAAAIATALGAATVVVN
jgi:TolB-like protein